MRSFMTTVAAVAVGAVAAAVLTHFLKKTEIGAKVLA